MVSRGTKHTKIFTITVFSIRKYRRKLQQQMSPKKEHCFTKSTHSFDKNMNKNRQKTKIQVLFPCKPRYNKTAHQFDAQKEEKTSKT